MRIPARRLLANTSLLGVLAMGAVACEASVDEEGANLDVEEPEDD